MRKLILIGAPIALLAAAGGVWLWARPKANPSTAKQSYETAKVTRGSIESTVSSSGTLSAVSTVDILAQMSGRVEKVNADYNDHVKKGQVLVELNTDMLKLEEKENEAAVRKAQANYDLQLQNYQNQEKLAAKELIAEYDLKTSKTTLEVDEAELASAQANLDVTLTKLNQYARITSPIDGIVLNCNVEVGQNVLEGSSSNASSLFTIAEDLSKMEIQAEVDELDISSIKVGQDVRFTVEAEPGLTFNGKVHEIRLVPKTTDNVVTYYVMIDAGNKDGKLLPGMTAEAEFIKENRQNVLVVPSAALRFQPTGLSDKEIQSMTLAAQIAGLPPDQRDAALKAQAAAQGGAGAAAVNAQNRPKGLTGMMMPQRPQHDRKNANSAQDAVPAAAKNMKSLWYLDAGGRLAVRMVEVGASNGTSTEIVGADDLEGQAIIVKAKVE